MRGTAAARSPDRRQSVWAGTVVPPRRRQGDDAVIVHREHGDARAIVGEPRHVPETDLDRHAAIFDLEHQIAISAYGRDETIARALERGAVDYQVKPFSANELAARVQAALRKRAGPEAFALGDLAVDYEVAP